MKKTVLILCAVALAGCASMTPEEKRAAWIVGGIVVAGAVAASSGGSSGGPDCTIAVTPGGSDRSCR